MALDYAEGSASDSVPGFRDDPQSSPTDCSTSQPSTTISSRSRPRAGMRCGDWKVCGNLVQDPKAVLTQQTGSPWTWLMGQRESDAGASRLAISGKSDLRQRHLLGQQLPQRELFLFRPRFGHRRAAMGGHNRWFCPRAGGDNGGCLRRHVRAEPGVRRQHLALALPPEPTL